MPEWKCDFCPCFPACKRPPFAVQGTACVGRAAVNPISALWRLQCVSSLGTVCALKDPACRWATDREGHRELSGVEASCRNAQHPNSSLKRSLWEVAVSFIGNRIEAGQGCDSGSESAWGCFPMRPSWLFSSLSHPPCCYGTVKTLCCCFLALTKSPQHLTSSLPPPTAPSLQLSAPVLHPIPWAAFVPSVLGSWVDLPGVNSCSAAGIDLVTREGRSWERAGINSLQEKAQDEDPIWIPPQAVMTVTRRCRLWLLYQPLNQLDQCCRSDILVLNACSVYCVFPCLLPHADGSPLRSQLSVNVRRDVNPEALGDLGREGSGGTSDAPRHSSCFLAPLSFMGALLFLPNQFI